MNRTIALAPATGIRALMRMVSPGEPVTLRITGCGGYWLSELAWESYRGSGSFRIEVAHGEPVNVMGVPASEHVVLASDAAVGYLGGALGPPSPSGWFIEAGSLSAEVLAMDVRSIIIRPTGTKLVTVGICVKWVSA